MIARYYNPEHGVFLSIDPDPGDEDDPVTQNGYTYADNNPMMMTDSDGHSPTLLINAGFAIYDGYGAYKSGANWKRIGIASAKGFVGGGRIGAAKRALKGANYLIRPGKYAKGSIPAFKGKSRNFSANTRKVINELGNKNGCHSCGVKRPGTKSGNWIPDHLPANSLAKKRVKQRLYPQCLKCSRKQGGRLSAIAKKKKAFNRRNN